MRCLRYAYVRGFTSTNAFVPKLIPKQFNLTQNSRPIFSLRVPINCNTRQKPSPHRFFSNPTNPTEKSKEKYLKLKLKYYKTKKENQVLYSQKDKSEMGWLAIIKYEFIKFILSFVVFILEILCFLI